QNAFTTTGTGTKSGFFTPDDLKSLLQELQLKVTSTGDHAALGISEGASVTVSGQNVYFQQVDISPTVTAVLQSAFTTTGTGTKSSFFTPDDLKGLLQTLQLDANISGDHYLVHGQQGGSFNLTGQNGIFVQDNISPA